MPIQHIDALRQFVKLGSRTNVCTDYVIYMVCRSQFLGTLHSWYAACTL